MISEAARQNKKLRFSIEQLEKKVEATRLEKAELEGALAVFQDKEEKREQKEQAARNTERDMFAVQERKYQDEISWLREVVLILTVPGEKLEKLENIINERAEKLARGGRY